MSDVSNLPSKEEQINNIPMHMDAEVLSTIMGMIPEGSTELPPEAIHLFKQTAMRMILFQVCEVYPDEVRSLLGEKAFSEDGHVLVLMDGSDILPEFYAFVCKNVIGMVPDIDIEITDSDND